MSLRIRGELRDAVVIGAAVAGIVGVAATIEVTGGLPSQLVHIYYLPVVVAALTLSRRWSLLVALLASLAVSPVIDLLRQPFGFAPYFPDVAPWKVSASGWVVRPAAFFALSLLAGAFLRSKQAEVVASETSAARGAELVLLSRVDKMILSDVPEQEVLQELARLLAEHMRSRMAGVVVKGEGGTTQVFYGYVRNDVGSYFVREEQPLGGGVSGWTLLHRRVATTSDILADPRYDTPNSFGHRHGYRSAASVPILLDDAVVAALTVGRAAVGPFSNEELASLSRLADQAAIAVGHSRQRDSLRRITIETATVLMDVIESRDAYTAEHSSRLVRYSSAIARGISLPDQALETVRLGAALHDVGKVAVPDTILRKPERLTPDEFAIVKSHCYVGGQICKRVRFLESARPIVYHHHERFDGDGYPDGLAGEAIPLGARIVAIADSFDAMTSDRPYRAALALDEAVRRLRDGAGRQWDPALIEVFLDWVGSEDYLSRAA